MGMIRSWLLVIAAGFLLISLVAANTFLTLGSSLEYDNVREELVPVMAELAGEGISEGINASYDELIEECQNNSELVLGGNQSLKIKCDVVPEGPNAITNSIIEQMVANSYYAEYDCNFLDCDVSDNPFFIVSDHSMNYFKSKFSSILFLSIALFLLVFVLTENRSNAFVITGALMIVAALPFAKLEWVFSAIGQVEFLSVFTFMFTQAFSIFWKGLIFGIVLIALGFAWKTFAIGFKINSFFQKFNNKKKVVVKEKVVSKKSKKGEVVKE